MSEAPERTQYATSILVSQKPIDATEIVRVRLSQAKLLNDEFSTFFKRYYAIKSHYLNDLNKLVNESQDLNKNIEHSILEHQVLSRDEIKHYNIDAIGHLSEIWNKIIGEIKDEISANNVLRQVVEREVVHPLVNYTSKNPNWSQVRNLHAKLSEVAQTIEYNQEKVDKYNENPSKYGEKLEKYQAALQSANNTWASEAPFVFEAFENTDVSRLNFLRDGLLRFITAYTDSLNKISASNERTLETILNFNPETEIARFAKVSSETKYIPKETRKAAESPQTQSHHTFPSIGGNGTFSSPLGHRNASVSTSATAASTTASTKEAKTPKQRTKLRSKVGSIFGKKKKDKAKFQPSESLAESESSSRLSRSSSLASAAALRSHTTSGSNLNPSKRQANQDEDDSLYEPKQTYNAPNPIPKNSPVVSKFQAPITNQPHAPLSLNQAPLQPSSRTNTLNSTPVGLNGTPTSENTAQRSVSDNSYSDQVSNINVQEQSQHQFQQQQEQPVTQIPLVQQHSTTSSFTSSEPSTLQESSQWNDQHRAPPVPPPARKSTHFGNQNLGNIREDGDFSFSRPAHSESLPQPPTSRRDIQSGLFTNLNQSDLENHQTKRLSSFNSFGSQQLRPQTTGSSILGASSGLFNHPSLTLPGLNASIAEVINAKFKDGEQISGQTIGEIAFNYQENGNTSGKVNLKIIGSEKFDKIIPNNQFLKQLDSDVFEVTLGPISARTLGGLKFSIKDIKAPIIVLPVWRFETHQASVMLTIKLAPHVASLLQPGDVVQLENLIVSVAIQGQSSSALSKPQGTFNKEKSRISWRFTEPVTLSSDNEQKLVARFITETEAKETEQGVLVKFSVNDDGNSKYVTSGVELETEDITEDDPFAQDSWKLVPSFKTLVAGNYSGLS